MTNTNHTSTQYAKGLRSSDALNSNSYFTPLGYIDVRMTELLLS
jgi:hypothetical protein